MATTQAGQTREAVFADLLEQLRHERTTETAFVAHLSSGIVNKVLSCELAVIGTEGFLERNFGTAIGSVAIANHSETDVILASGGPGGVAPASGHAMALVGAGYGTVVNLTGHQLTVYGVEGSVVGLQVFTRPQPPTYGAV